MDKLVIYEDCKDRCSLCNKDFKWRCYYRSAGSIGELPLKEFDLVTAHAGCRNLMKKRQDIKSKLVDIEFKIWEKKYFI
jgi:hypothetical protein